MEIRIKIRDYLDRNGIKNSWFADTIGISHQMLSQILTGRKKLSLEVGDKIIKATNGHITLSDILREEYKKIKFLQVIEGKAFDKCEVIIKNIKRED